MRTRTVTDRDFRGQPRKNETHASTTDPEARLYTKSRGQAAKLSFMAHVFMENRCGLPLDIIVTQATGRAEREAAITMLKRRPGIHRRATVEADKAYDTRDFVERCRELDEVTPEKLQEVARKTFSRQNLTCVAVGPPVGKGEEKLAQAVARLELP